MLQYLNELNAWLLTLLVVGVAVVYSTGLMLLSRRRYGTSYLSLNNEVAGFKYAVVGVFYAVLIAFVVIAVWEDYSETEAAVRNEAKALVDLHQVSYALPASAGETIRKQVIAYATEVRDVEWADMAAGGRSPSAQDELQRLSQAIFDGRPEQPKDVALYQHALDLLTQINDNRNERLDSSDGSVPPILWLVLVAGGLVTLGYPAFFGSTNLGAQVLMTASLAALVALTLLVGLMLDYPFTGDVRISPGPFDQALKEMPTQWPPP